MNTPERLNSLSHLIGAIVALAGSVVLIVFASLQGEIWKIISFTVYGISLFLLYLFSTLYHGTTGKRRAVFRKFDHLAIYILIAGTYTPFTLITLKGNWGWILFTLVWLLALLGIWIDIFVIRGRRILPVVVYMLMGWLCIIAIQPLLLSLTQEGFFWLLTGGLFYTVGIVFFALDKSNDYFHVIWHLFVLAGSTVHYLTIYRYVL